MSTRCTRARARAFEHKREVGRQSVRAVSSILNDMRDPSDIFLTCTWICMGLDGSTCSECLPVVTCDLEPPEYVPRTSARAQPCAVVSGRHLTKTLLLINIIYPPLHFDYDFAYRVKVDDFCLFALGVVADLCC